MSRKHVPGDGRVERKVLWSCDLTDCESKEAMSKDARKPLGWVIAGGMGKFKDYCSVAHADAAGAPASPRS